jgi:hypothetical protein
MQCLPSLVSTPSHPITTRTLAPRAWNTAHRPPLHGLPFCGASICEGEPQLWATTHRHAVFLRLPRPRLCHAMAVCKLWVFLEAQARGQTVELYSSTSERLRSTEPRLGLVWLAPWDEERSLQLSIHIFAKKQHHVHVRRAVTIAIRCPDSPDRATIRHILCMS